MKKSLIFVVAIVVVTLGVGVYLFTSTRSINQLKPVACTEEAKLCPDGSTVGRIGSKCEFPACPEVLSTTSDLIKVSTPLPNAIVSSPVIITGEARGTWYFEASFPARIYDANKKLLGSAPAQAQSEWMTTNFVPFKTTLSFSKPTTATGTLVLVKDNPSGLPQNDNSISIPVVFIVSK